MTHKSGTPPLNTHNPHLLAELIQFTLEKRGVDSPIVAPLCDGPQVLTFQAILPAGARPNRVARLSDAIALATGTDTCRVSHSEGKLIIEVPKPKQERKILRPANIQVAPPTSWHVPLGAGMDGKAVWLDLQDPRSCHVLIGGTTRSGKTNLLRWILYRLLTQNRPQYLRLLLADAKRNELIPFELSQHLLHPPAANVHHIIQLLMWTHEKAITRTRTKASGEPCYPRIIMVIDEVKELVDQDKSVQVHISQLAQIGAGVNVNLIVTTQQPGAKSMGDALPNFPLRIIGQVSARQLVYGATGTPQTAADSLLSYGDMMAVWGTTPVRFQAPLITEADLEAIPRYESSDQVPRLELPETLEILDAGIDSRGGHNRTEFNDRELEMLKMLVELGATASQINNRLNIHWDRAKRIVERLGAS